MTFIWILNRDLAIITNWVKMSLVKFDPCNTEAILFSFIISEFLPNICNVKFVNVINI